MTIYYTSLLRSRKDSGKYELLCRDPDPVITRGRDPDPDERNDYFDFSLSFLARNHCHRLTTLKHSHGSELDVKIQVNTNYCVVTRIPSSRKNVIRIPTNIT